MKGVPSAEDWCLAERQRLKNEYMQACFFLADVARKDGRFEEELCYLQNAVEQDPYDEAANKKLIEAYRHLGKQNCALALQSAFAKRLNGLG